MCVFESEVTTTSVTKRLTKRPKGKRVSLSKWTPKNQLLAGGVIVLLFSPLLGEDVQFDSYFSSGFKPPSRL